jgi:PPOX class probable F420-dependent enzyme
MAHELAESRYVNITTYRRNGEGLSNPMWIAPDGDRLVMVTSADSAKVKRLRRDPRIRLARSDARGRVPDEAVMFEATAELLDDEGTASAQRGIKAKYGLQATLIDLYNGLVHLVLRRDEPRVGIAITLDT